MTKSELIRKLAEKENLDPEYAKSAVEFVFTSMTNSLAQGGRVDLRGFCSFSVKEYKSYTGRDPRSGATVKVKSKKLPFFKCGKNLKNRINAAHTLENTKL